MVTGPLGALRFGLDRGVPIYPYPSLKVILAEKGTIVKDFKNRPIFHKFCDFQGFCHAKAQKFGLSQKITVIKDFFF